MSSTIALPFDYARLPELPAGVYTAPLRRPAHIGEDWLEPAQHAYSPAEHAIWDDLYARQMDVLPGRACSAFLAGLERLDLGQGGVPDFARLSSRLGALTG
ncbi:MAG: phenylalanine 4-monooxygenase, partial [Novosphingobium sp.]